MVREKVQRKRAKADQSSFSLEEESRNEEELMELYEGETNKNMENIESLETMLETEDISDASAQIEEYSQRYEQDEEMVQCVPELQLVYTPEKPNNKPEATGKRNRPRMKITPQRKSSEKAPKKKRKSSKHSISVATQILNVTSESEDEFPKAKKEGTWVQCANTDCLKWRKLPNDIEPNAMPHRWVCAMNPDSSRTSCTASQETCDSQLDFDVVYTPYIAGSLVWAKVPGYPWWPGMVEDDPDYNCCYETDESNVNPISYHVSFIFDKEVSRSWVSYLGIRNFDGTGNPNEISKQKKYGKSLARALVQARNAMELTLAQRIQTFSFNVLYKGQIGSETDEKPRKMKKRKQAKTTSQQLGDPKKTKEMKPQKKTKRPSLTDSEKSGENSQHVLKKKVKKRKRVLASSDEESNEKDTTSPAIAINNDNSQNLAGNLHDEKDCVATTEEEKHHSSHVQLEDEDDDIKSVQTTDQVPPQIDYSNTEGEEKNEKSKDKSKKKNKLGKAKTAGFISVPQKKRKSVPCDEGENPTKSRSPDHMKAKKKKLKKSGEETKTSEKKKSKFVKPAKLKSESVLNASDVSDDSLRGRLLEKLALDTSTDSMDKDTSTEDISHTEKPNTSLEASHQPPVDKETANDCKESLDSKRTPPLKPKKKKWCKASKDKSASNDSTKTMVAVVKPKKFELTLPTSKKNKPTDERKVKKVKKTSSPKRSGKEKTGTPRQECASPSEIVLDGNSVKPIKASNAQDNEKKTTSKTKRMKQTFGKFKAPVKANSKVTPSASSASKEKDEAMKTLEEVLDISSDDPRKNPEKYVSIDSLEKDISNLYQELSENAEAPGGVRDVTEADGRVTVEFLDRQISGNTKNSQKMPRRRLTDSPEF